MSAIDLDAIRARCDKATAGPWWASDPLSVEADSAYAVCRDTGEARAEIVVITLGDCDQGLDISRTDREADSEFIAAARQDVPALLAEVARLHADLAEARATCTCGTSYETYEGPEPDCPVHGAIRALDEATAEISRLRADLAEAQRMIGAVAYLCDTTTEVNLAWRVVRVKALRGALSPGRAATGQEE